MKIEALHIGMKIEHPHYGTGTVRSIAENAVTIQFHDTARTVSPETSGIEPHLAETPAPSAFGIPLTDLVGKAVQQTLAALGVEPPESVVEGLAARWDGGKLVLVPENPANQSKEIPLEVFFHKIVMMRNNLRVLEQKINAHEKLTDADKVELQQYISKCYGSMTTFNILFREKADAFESR